MDVEKINSHLQDESLKITKYPTKELTSKTTGWKYLVYLFKVNDDIKNLAVITKSNLRNPKPYEVAARVKRSIIGYRIKHGNQ